MKITMNDIFKNDGAISVFKEGYKERPSQKEAASIIYDALINNNKNVLIEGETGMGKSFAYLFPVLKKIIESNFQNRAVIVTSGISLQEQLNEKDIPFAIEVMKSIYPNITDELEFSLLKGRQNFICNEKVAKLGLYDISRTMIDSSYEELYDFVNTTKTGDLSELNFILPSDKLEQVACTKKGECLSRNCSSYNECHYMAHRTKLQSSRIVITNYHMLFADQNIGGKILPTYDILVFDEAHEAADIFRDFDSVKLSHNNMFMLRNKCSEVNNLSDRYSKLLSVDLFTSVFKEFEIAFSHIDSKFPSLESPVIIHSVDEIPKSFFELRQSLTTIANCIDEACSSCEQSLVMYSDNCGEDEEVAKLSKINHSLLVMQSMAADMNLLISLMHELLQNDNNVIWVEKINDIVSVNYKKVEVGEAMNKAFFNSNAITSIFTSATMSVSGSFQYIKEQLGLTTSTKDTIEFIGSSPFDLEKQQLWYLPEDTIDGNKFGFDKAISSQILNIVNATNGGALCLFTSVRNMRNTYFELQYKIKQKIYIQGDMPKSRLIEKFKEDKDSILFATKSFFTGVDVPGNSLRCVVIDKFPFPQPSDPVQQKLKDRSNSFYKYSIPSMVISLKQAVGRGVRSVDDKCVIAILDGRMSTAKYKGKINSSFGYKKTGTRNIDDVKLFCKDLIDDSTDEWNDELDDYGNDMPF